MIDLFLLPFLLAFFSNMTAIMGDW